MVTFLSYIDMLFNLAFKKLNFNYNTFFTPVSRKHESSTFQLKTHLDVDKFRCGYCTPTFCVIIKNYKTFWGLKNPNQKELLNY